jgi:HPt (histidine-containing phosphotransfer) domain-containing protein
MLAEADRLSAAHLAALNGNFAPAACEDLFRATHDIKGDAATFGYPYAASAAESLCRIIEHAPDVAKVPRELIAHHVNAILAIVHNHTRLDSTVVGSQLCQRLRGVADEYLMRVNRDRPEHLEAITAPSIVPTD